MGLTSGPWPRSRRSKAASGRGKDGKDDCLPGNWGARVDLLGSVQRAE